MKPAFITEIKSSGSYFMTSINGQNFRHNGLLLPHSSIICRKYRPLIEVMNYSHSNFMSTFNNQFISIRDTRTKTLVIRCLSGYTEFVAQRVQQLHELHNYDVHIFFLQVIPDGILNQLLSINAIKAWFKSNWYFILIGFLLLIVLLVSLCTKLL